MNMTILYTVILTSIVWYSYFIVAILVPPPYFPLVPKKVPGPGYIMHEVPVTHIFYCVWLKHKWKHVSQAPYRYVSALECL